MFATFSTIPLSAPVRVRAAMVAAAKGSCLHNWMYSLYRSARSVVVISVSPWDVLSSCCMNNLHKTIIVFRGWINVTYECVEKAFQSAFLTSMWYRFH